MKSRWITKAEMRGGTFPVRFVFIKKPKLWTAQVMHEDELMVGVHAKPNASGFGRFLERFICDYQDHAVLEASVNGRIIAPENCVKMFWTARHITRLAAALKCPRKSVPLDMAKLYMRQYWTERGLNKMDRNELAAHVNEHCEMEITPAAIWKIYSRSDWITLRTNGPKHRPP